MTSTVKPTRLNSQRDSADDLNADRLLREVVRLNNITVAIAFGFLGAVGLFVATMWLVLKGGEQVGPHLGLLSNYFPGYRVTFLGSFIGFGYGFLTAFTAGYLISWLYNYIVWLRKR